MKESIYSLESRFYRAFEDRFRGASELISERLKVYLPYLIFLQSSYDVGPQAALDVRCGRGEWLELLKDEGFAANRVDLGVHLDTKFAKAKVTEHPGMSIETGSDLAQAISRSHLSKDHTDEMLPALEMTVARLRSVSGVASGTCPAIDDFDYMREDVATSVNLSKPLEIPLRSTNA